MLEVPSCAPPCCVQRTGCSAYRLRLPFFLRAPPMYTTLLVSVLLAIRLRRPPFAFVFVLAGVPAFSLLCSFFLFSLSHLVALGVAPGPPFALLVRFRPLFLSSFAFAFPPGSPFSGVPFALSVWCMMYAAYDIIIRFAKEFGWAHMWIKMASKKNGGWEVKSTDTLSTASKSALDAVYLCTVSHELSDPNSLIRTLRSVSPKVSFSSKSFPMPASPKMSFSPRCRFPFDYSFQCRSPCLHSWGRTPICSYFPQTSENVSPFFHTAFRYAFTNVTSGFFCVSRV